MRKGEVELFQISRKGEFFVSYNNQVLLNVISRCARPFLHLKKAFPLPNQFGQERNTVGYSFERRVY